METVTKKGSPVWNRVAAELLEVVVRRTDRVEHDQVLAEVRRFQIVTDSELVEIDGHFGEFVALSGDGVDHKALVAQSFDALPDRLTRYAETRRERLSGNMVLRVRQYFE